MARGRGRGDYALSFRGIPETPRLNAPAQAPQAPGTPKMILKADGRLVESYRPPTEAEKAARAEQERIEGQKIIDAFLAKARGGFCEG